MHECLISENLFGKGVLGKGYEDWKGVTQDEQQNCHQVHQCHDHPSRQEGTDQGVRAYQCLMEI